MINFYACGTHDKEGKPSAFAVWAVGNEQQVRQACESFDMQYLSTLSSRKHYGVKEVVLSATSNALDELINLLDTFEAKGELLEWMDDYIPGGPSPCRTNTFATRQQALGLY